MILSEQDRENFSRLVAALDPWLGRIVIVGGWAYRLYRLHPVAQQLEYPPVVTLDADVALPSRLPAGDPDLRQRLLSHGFQEELLGHHQPPVTHYHLGSGTGGFYVEFLTPLIGSGYKRNQTKCNNEGRRSSLTEFASSRFTAPFALVNRFGQDG